MAKDFYSVTDAAKEIGISRQRLWWYINDGRCARIGQGRSVLIPKSAIAIMKRLTNGKKKGK